MKPALEPTPSASTRAIASRWGKVNTAAGWTALPSVLFQRQKALLLDAVDLNIILHLAGHWWDADRFPYPSVNTLALAVGKTPRTIQRRIKELETIGYVKRIRRSKDKRSISNAYDLSGLVKACEPFAKEQIEEREQRKKEAVARSTRKKPVSLKLVPTSSA
jgi:DNA-binding transcriptional regulator YhcF (GntR family)